MRSQLLKRADVLNELLAEPRSGEERPSSPDEYDNPFCSKTHEENRVASISQHESPKFLPPRDENRTHLDDEVKKELELEKSASDSHDWIQKAQALSSTEVRLLKLIQKKSGQDLIGVIMPYTGMNSKQLLQVVNRLISQGYIGNKNGNPVKTEITDRLIMTYDSLKGGAVTAGWNAPLLRR